ncbi:hypothetical protein LP416_22825 [Polaromonas sp. P2-4]|nr:hypothetical protein LP416_22825 [Polaromonas sp. P2-4]
MLLHRFQQLTIRSKLLAMVLVPLALVLPLLGLLLLVWGNVAFDRLLVTKVQSDLAVARGYFRSRAGRGGRQHWCGGRLSCAAPGAGRTGRRPGGPAA